MLGGMSRPPAPPPPNLELDRLLFAMLLGVLVLLAVLLALGGPWLGYYAVHLWLPLWLIPCVVFGGARLSDRPEWLRRWVRVARGQFVDYGGGFYGAVALVAFVWAEWAQLEELGRFLVGLPSVQELVQSFIHFGVSSFMNGVWAMVWPAFHAKTFEMRNFWPALGIGAGIFGAAQGLMAWLPARPRT